MKGIIILSTCALDWFYLCAPDTHHAVQHLYSAYDLRNCPTQTQYDGNVAVQRLEILPIDLALIIIAT